MHNYCIKRIYILSVLIVAFVLTINTIYANAAEYQENVSEDEISMISEELKQYLNQQDYEVSYTADDLGNTTWYLINNLEGTRIKVSEINKIVTDAENYASENYELSQKNKVQKTSIIVLVIILLLSLILNVILSVLCKSRKHRRSGFSQSRPKRKRDSYDDMIDSGAREFYDN